MPSLWKRWPRSWGAGFLPGCRLPGVLESVLVANRGEIARRVIATARRLWRPLHRGLLGGRRRPAVRRRGRRRGSDRPGAAGGELSERACRAGRRAADRRPGDPSRLRLPRGERGVRRQRRGGRPHLGWPGAGLDRSDGRQDQRPESDGTGRRAGISRDAAAGRRPGRCARGSRSDRLPGHDQGVRWRRRNRHERGRRSGPADGRIRDGKVSGRAFLRQSGDLARTLRAARSPRRSPDPRPRRRPRPRARRAGLLRATAPPEGR